MSGNSKSLSVVVCALICAACSPEAGVGVAPVIPPQESGLSQRVTGLELSPDSIILDEGGEQQIVAIVRNQSGFSMGFDAPINYSSTSSITAMVGPAGFVTAITPGRTVIRASLVVGEKTFSDSTIVVVRKAAVMNEVVLKAVFSGWTPLPAHVVAGGRIEWQPGIVAGGGFTTTIYVWRDEIGFGESIDIGAGPNSMVLTVPGKYRYCSNACWDPPEFGIIVVH
jgi:hypothetical protein